MENFFIEDKFYNDIESLLIDFEIDEDNIAELPDDWSQEVILGTLEPVFDLNQESFERMLYGWFGDDRMPEDWDEKLENKITEAIRQSVDFEKLSNLLPKFYYGYGEKAIITKQDLLEYI